MATKVERPDLSALVVLDSNAVLGPSETELISKQVDQQFAEIQKIDTIEFILPRVVAGEVLFRKNWALMNLRNNADRAAGALAQLSETSKPEIPSASVLTRRLQSRFIKWCRGHNIVLWRVPFDTIRWRQIVSLSINRKGPFSPFEPKGKSEKGFRDSIVLETLCDVCSKKAEKKIVFLTGDELLASAAKARLGKQITVYKELQEYLSYLTLQRQNFLQKSITVMLEEARAAFYQPGEPKSLYYKFDIPAKLLSTFPSEFLKTPPTLSGPAFLGFASLVQETFTPTTSEGYRVEGTNVGKYDSTSKRMIFQTRVLAAKGFQSPNQFTTEQLRLIEASVSWSAKVSIAGEITLQDVKFESIKLEQTTFESATNERLKSFNLPTRLERLMASFPYNPPGSDVPPQK